MENPRFWYAVATKVRHEAVVSRFLHATGTEQFLPTFQVQRCWSDRVKVAEEPMFAGYLFCRIAPQSARSVLAVPGVARLLGCGTNIEPIPDLEVEAIQRLVLNRFPISPCPYPSQGDPVRVTRGPLKGLLGTLVKIKSQSRFVLSVNLLQRSIFVELDGGSVESVP